MERKLLYIGMDVHKKSIEIAIAESGREGEIRHYGAIPSTMEALDKAIRKLQSRGHQLRFVYEAGPCGFEIYRYLTSRQMDCAIIAPSLIPKQSGDRIKTDKRDAIALARLHRAGELTEIHVPDAEDEAMRDLIRAREDIVYARTKSKAQLGAFLLRNGHNYQGGSNWTQAHLRWLAELRMSHPAQQFTFQEYVDSVQNLDQRVKRIESEIERLVESWQMKQVVFALMSFRGISRITACTIASELGDIRRFDHPKSLTRYLGLTPSEYSSGEKTKRGGITKTGNPHVRRVLIESAWAYRFQARVSNALRKRQENLPEYVNAISWKAQLRLCHRYKKLLLRGKGRQKTLVAIARELVGFIWDVATQVSKESGPPKRMKLNQKMMEISQAVPIIACH